MMEPAGKQTARCEKPPGLADAPASVPGSGNIARKPPLAHGVVWAGAGHAIYLACQYGMLMALAKLGSAQMLGDFSLALAITAPLIILSQMQLRQVQVTDVKSEHSLAEYFYARAALTVLALLAIALLILGSGYSRMLGSLILILGIAKSAESLSDIFYGYLQARERMDLVALSMSIKGVVSIAAFAGVLRATGDLLYAASSIAAVWVLLLIALDRPLQQHAGRETLRWPVRLPRTVFKLTAISLPLAFASGLAALSGNIPRYFLASYQGSEAVALFTVAAAPLALINLLAYATSQATLSRAASAFQSGDFRAFHVIARGITASQCGLAAACTALFWFFGPQLLSLFFAPEYAAAAPVLVVLSAAVTIGSVSAYGHAVYAAGRAFWLQPLPILLGVVLQLIVCGWLARLQGALGAAWADVIKYLFCTVFISVTSAWVLRRHRAAGLCKSTGEAAP